MPTKMRVLQIFWMKDFKKISKIVVMLEKRGIKAPHLSTRRRGSR